MADPKSPSRDVLAKFLSDHESIKKFERLFEVAGDLTPTDVAILYRLTQEASTDAGIADAKANEALDSLNRIAQSLEFLALAPTIQEAGDDSSNLSPPVAELNCNSDNLSPPTAELNCNYGDLSPPMSPLSDSDLAAYALKSGNLSQFAATTSAQLAGVISDETGSGALVFGTSPTMTTPKATSTIGVGNATPSASGSGITFPASASLSSDVNTLDDYEEGTFTPTYAPASGSFTSLTVVGAGRYIKIGKTVYVWIDMRTTGVSVIGTASGILYITGMPFTCDSNGGYACASIFQAFNLGVAFTNLGGIVEASQTRVYLTKNSSNSGVTYVQATEINPLIGNFNNLIGLFGRYTTAS